MSLYGALAEAFRRNERVDRGIGAVTGSLAVTTGVDVINSAWVDVDKATAPEALVLSWGASNNLLTIYAWKIAAAAPTITVTNALAAAGAVTTFTPGASTVAAQYTGTVAGLLTVTGGTWTDISVSRDNSTFYDLGTQAAFAVSPNDYIKITYSSVPTCKVLPFPATNISATSSAPAMSTSASSTAVNVSWGVVGTSYAQHPYPGA